MRYNSEQGQVLRIDGKNCFLEVMADCCGFDKVSINFLSYDANAVRGSRKQGAINIYIDMLEAQVLARDIMSGRIPALAKMEKERMQKANEKYARAIYVKQGGTSASRNNNRAIARSFEISPGSSQPWIFTAKQGLAHETPEGLIVMDGKPDCTIRVPCSDEKLKEFAMAIEAVVSVWIQLRFVPAAMPGMRAADERRARILADAKAASSTPATTPEVVN